jgi:hypothetical protein
MRRFYKPSLWIPQHFLFTNPNLHHGLLGKDSPEPRSIQPEHMGRVVALPQIGGLHHRYERRAA